VFFGSISTEHSIRSDDPAHKHKAADVYVSSTEERSPCCPLFLAALGATRPQRRRRHTVCRTEKALREPPLVSVRRARRAQHARSTRSTLLRDHGSTLDQEKTAVLPKAPAPVLPPAYPGTVRAAGPGVGATLLRALRGLIGLLPAPRRQGHLEQAAHRGRWSELLERVSAFALVASVAVTVLLIASRLLSNLVFR
jgi:hypothetical protein